MMSRIRYVRLMLRWLITTAVLACTLWCQTGLARLDTGRAVDLSSTAEVLTLHPFITVLEDCSRELDVAQVDDLSRAEPSRFTRSENISFGYSTCAFWLRVALRESGATHSEWYLTVEEPRLNHVDFYQRQGTSWKALHSGRTLKLSERPVYSRNHAFPLGVLGSTPEAVYLRIQTNDVVILPVTAITRQAWLQSELQQEFAMGLYLGVLLATMLVNIIVFTYVRERVHFFFLAVVFCFGMFQASVNAMDLEYFWPQHPAWNMRAVPIFCGLTIASYVYFSWQLLRMHEIAPGMRSFMQLLIGSGIAMVLLAVIGSVNAAGMFGSFASPAALVGVGAMGVVAIAKGSPYAKYSILAGFFQVVGVLSDALRNLAVLPASPFTVHANKVTSTLFIGALTVALAERIATVYRERDQAKRTAAELSRATTEAKLQALQARINPHFLFNTLTSITGLIREAPERAEAVVLKLSKLFRYTLAVTEEGTQVRLSDELTIVRSYLEIERERFGERLDFRIEVEGNADLVMLPGLTLQPLVENCIKHGLKNKREDGQVLVSAQIVGSRCRLIVQDNGSGMSLDEPQLGHGVASVRRRLQLAYGGAAEMSLVSVDGLRVLIELPVPQPA